MVNTPNLDLEKPEVDGDNNAWGEKLNDNFDKIDEGVLKRDGSNVGDEASKEIFLNNVGAAKNLPVRIFNGDDIGNMTAGGGLEAASNGVIEQTAANSAATSTASASGSYVGKTFGAARRVNRIVVHAPSDGGFLSTGATCTLRFYGKNGAAPTAFNDGTILVDQQVAANEPGLDVELINPDPTQVWQHTWVGVVPDGNTAVKRVAELEIFVLDQALLVIGPEAEAIDGSDNKNAMSALRTTQRIRAEVLSYSHVNIRQHANADNSGTTDNVEAMHKALSLLPVRGGKITGPPGRYLLNSGGSDVPVDVNQDNVTLDFDGPSAEFVVGAAERHLIRIGNGQTEGNRVKGFRARKFGFDGASIDDNSNDFAKLFARYVEDCVIEEISCRNMGGTAVRVGRGPLGWSLANQRSRRARVINCYFENIKEIPIEMHGTEKSLVALNTIVGGALSIGNPASIGVRYVKSLDLMIVDNNIHSMSRGIAGSTTAGDDQQFVTIHDNKVRGSIVSALSASGPATALSVTENKFYGSLGDYVCQIHDNGNPILADIDFSGNWVWSGSTANVAGLLVQASGGRLFAKSNKFRMLHNAAALADAIRLQGCAGLAEVESNMFDTVSAINAIADVGGTSSLRLFALRNTHYRGTGSLLRNDGSSGTHIMNDGGGQTNVQFTR
jgi:hypothetical protein